jgi:putative membrane protein
VIDRKLDRLTPLARATTVSPGIVLAVLFLGAGSGWARVIGAAATIVVLYTFGLGLMWLEWRRYSFGFDESGDFRVQKGVVQHSHQKVQLSRLQSVEVTQPLVPRLFGLAEVIIEVAGAGDSRVRVSYLDKDSAHALRNEIIARAAGVDAAAPTAPENVLTTVDNGQLLLSLLLRFRTVGLFVLTAMLLVTSFLTGGWGALGIALVTGGVPAFGVANEFLLRYGFTVAESPDGLRVRHGLTSTVANTVPPGRVHAVGFSSGPIWRLFGWVRVVVDLAGSPGSGDSGRQDSTTLIPVTDWDTALDVVARVLPGVDLREIDFSRVPDRARWRAPLQWRRLGVSVDDRVFIARRGRIERWLTVVPHGRVQSVRITQGPWERGLRLASLHLDTVPGPVHVTLPHTDVASVRDLAEQEQDRARAARLGAGPDRWMISR